MNAKNAKPEFWIQFNSCLSDETAKKILISVVIVFCMEGSAGTVPTGSRVGSVD